ncbi:hypothetical protein [Modestobacter lapidis]|nr:hypothetical protein [Modestobacter lapidis]
MAPHLRHRLRALLSSLVDGLLVGGAEAALDLPARSRQRATVYAGLLAVTCADMLVKELPTLRRMARGLPSEPAPASDTTAAMASGLVCGAWGLAVTVVDGPAARALSRRGSRHPHLLLGALAGVATALSTLPIWWERAAARAAADDASEALDRELEALLSES